MKLSLLILSILTYALTLTSSAETIQSTYGKKFKYDKAYSLNEILTDINTISGKEVTLKAKVVKVCQSKGCWMGLQANDKSVRVTFEGYSFFVPMSLINKEVALKGKLFEKTISKKTARHYLSDEGKSKEEIEKITSDVKEYNFIASGVQVL
ncbi:DUF4920 domain-containing protein [Halobacteriovorax sp. HLS]|uniref:DUF4920 domain-containing protein n=1 Tax=Halobacteriovorax sp. HLS TaxID=2234000 RepID=UPI000FD773DA|nr:DUF4920 domain-containing protein [Halobacteriovorax sp. HLS]